MHQNLHAVLLSALDSGWAARWSNFLDAVGVKSDETAGVGEGSEVEEFNEMNRFDIVSATKQMEQASSTGTRRKLRYAKPLVHNTDSD